MSTEAIAALRRRLWEGGFKPIPLLTGEKHTQKTEWTTPAPPGPVERTYLNTGILTSGLRAVDIDIDAGPVADVVLDLVHKHCGADAPVRFRHNSPRCMLLYRAAEGAPGKRAIQGPVLGIDAKGKEIRDGVEILGDGQQIHAFGIHPSGFEVVWEDHAIPGDISIGDLKPVTEEQITALLAEVGPLIKAGAEKVRDLPADTKSADPLGAIDDVIAALALIPNTDSTTWDEWSRMAMGTYAATEGSDDGLNAFLAWSRKNGIHDEDVATEKWEHLNKSPPTLIGMGTLVHEARKVDATFRPPSGNPFTEVGTVTALATKPDAPDAPRRLLMGDDMWTMLTEAPPELVQGTIGVGALTVVSGGMGAGKSAWVSSVAHAVLTGAPWFGRETRQARVMILAGEGVRRTIHDFAANCQHHGQDHREVQRKGFAVHNGALLLNTPAGITTALERLEEFKACFGAYPDLLVVDTARKNFRGSVSDDKDVGVFYEHVALILGMGISVVVVAHTGKTPPGAASSGAKGSSDWEQGADYVLQMTGKVRDGETTIFFEKVKSGQDGDTIAMGYVFPDVPGVGTTPVAVPKAGASKPSPFVPVSNPKDTVTQENAKHKIAENAIAYVLSTNPSKPHSWRELSIAAAHYLGEQKQIGYTDDSIRNTHLKRMSNAGHPFYQRPTGKWRHVTQH